MRAPIHVALLSLALASSAWGQGQESFESFARGDYEEIATANGTWSAAPGTLQINTEHAEFGERCLRVAGGTQHFEFVASEAMASMSFVAERWTRDSPFELRVDCLVDDRWVELTNQISEIAVGGFKTWVHLRFPGETQRVRWSLLSKEGSGMMIDLIEVTRPGPIEWVSAKASAEPYPLLVGRVGSPVLAIDCDVRGNQGELSIESIDFEWTGDLDPKFILGYRWTWGQPRSLDVPIWEEGVSVEPIADGRVVGVPRRLWLLVTLSADAPLDARLGAVVQSISLSNGRAELVESEPSAPLQRLGVAVRDAGVDDVAVYRIPGLIRTNKGSLIAVYDIRHDGWSDLPGNIDVGMSRSIDGGRTWQPMQTILDFGDSEEFAGDGVGDPSVLVDRQTGTIWVAATWHHGNLGWFGSGPGLEPHQTGQVVLTRSDDDGLTWSPPINITRQIKKEAWAFLLPGPGRGICTEDGTLVLPAQFQNSPEEGRDPSSCVMFSTDHGKTWQLSEGARLRTTESAIVELPSGDWMLNMRDDRRNGMRTVATTDDRGVSWALVQSEQATALPGPVCMASLINWGSEVDGVPSRELLFANPAVANAPRRKMTLRRSTTAGQHWHEAQAIELDRGQSAGYSCLSMVDENTVGILYESSRAHLVFQRVPLTDFKP